MRRNNNSPDDVFCVIKRIRTVLLFSKQFQNDQLFDDQHLTIVVVNCVTDVFNVEGVLEEMGVVVIFIECDVMRLASGEFRADVESVAGWVR